MLRFELDAIRHLVTDLENMRFATKSGIQLVSHSVPNWRELVRNLVPRLVPNLVIHLVPDLVPDQMPNLILVVPDLVSQIWYQTCPRDLVLDLSLIHI